MGIICFQQFLCMLGNFSSYCCHLLTFFKITFFKNYFRNTIRVPNSLDPGPDSVKDDLDPICLIWLSADDNKWQLAGKELSEESKAHVLQQHFIRDCTDCQDKINLQIKYCNINFLEIITCEPPIYTLYNGPS